jgi:hypothetical protein
MLMMQCDSNRPTFSKSDEIWRVRAPHVTWWDGQTGFEKTRKYLLLSCNTQHFSLQRHAEKTIKR